MNTINTRHLRHRKPRLFRWALWWGLAIVAITVILLIVFQPSGADNPFEGAGPMMEAIYRMIYEFGLWPIMLYIGVVGPVFEELVFRLWGTGRAWTGYLSAALMAAMVWVTLSSWLWAAVALACGVGVMLVFRADRKRRLFSLMLLSSVLFAVAHAGNYDMGVGMLGVSLLHKFGMGLVASYLVINHGLLWSMAFHILNNSILMVPLWVGFNASASKVTTVETAGFSLEMRPVLVRERHDNQRMENVEADNLTVHYVDDISVIAYNLLMHCDNLGHTVELNPAPFPIVEIQVRFKEAAPDYQGVVKEMEKQGWLRLDTVWTSAPDGGADPTVSSLHIVPLYDPLQAL